MPHAAAHEYVACPIGGWTTNGRPLSRILQEELPFVPHWERRCQTPRHCCRREAAAARRSGEVGEEERKEGGKGGLQINRRPQTKPQRWKKKKTVCSIWWDLCDDAGVGIGSLPPSLPSGLQCRSLYYLLLFLSSPAEGTRGSCNVMTSQWRLLQFHPHEVTGIEPLQLPLRINNIWGHMTKDLSSWFLKVNLRYSAVFKSRLNAPICLFLLVGLQFL